MKSTIARAIAYVCVGMLLSTAVAQDEKSPETKAADTPAAPKQEFKLEVHAPNIEGFDPVSASTRLSADQRETIFDTIDTGNNQFAKKQYFAAAHAYKQAVEVDPDNVTLLKPLGRACVEAEFFDQAVIALEPVCQAKPEDKLAAATLVRAYIGLLEQAMAENIFDSTQESDLVSTPAADLLRKIRAIEPEHEKVKALADGDGNVTVAAKVDALRKTAEALRKKRRNPIVAMRLERLIILAPQDYPALVLLAATYSDLRLYEQAEVTYRQAMAIKTAGEDQQWLDVYLNGQVRYAMDLEEFPKAIAALTKLRKAHPSDPKFLIDLGRAYLGADGGKSERSIDTVRQAQSLMPTKSGVAIALAEIFKANAQMGQAVAALDSAAKSADNPGLVFKTLGDYHSEVVKVITLGRATARKVAAEKSAAEKAAAAKTATEAVAATKAAAVQATKEKAAADAAVAQKAALAKTAADNATTTASTAATAVTEATTAAKGAADKAAAAKLAADNAAADKVAAEKAAAEQVAAAKVSAEKVAAAKTAADKAAAAKTAADAAVAERTTAEKVAAEKTATATATAAKAAAEKSDKTQAAAEKAAGEKTAANQVVAEKAGIAKTAADQAAAAKTAAEVAAAEKTATEKATAEKTAVAKAAANKVAAPQVAADKAAADQAAAEQVAAGKVVAEKVAAAKTFTDQAAAAKTASEVAAAEKTAAEKIAAEKTASATAATEKVTAEKNDETQAAADKAAGEKTAAEQVVAEKAAAAKTTADQATVAKTAAEKGAAEKTAADKVAAEKTAAAKVAAEKATAAKVAADAAAALKVAAEKAAAEQVAAAKVSAEKAAAAKTAADKATAAKAAAEVAVAEKTAAEKLAAEKTAVATAAPAKVAATEAAAKKAGEALAAAKKGVADKTAAAKKLADQVASKKMPAYQEFDKPAIGKATAEKVAAEKTLSEATPASKAAADQLAPAKAAADKANAEKAAAEKTVPPLVAAAKTTGEKAAVEKVIVDNANAEKAAAEKVAAEKGAAAKTAGDLAAAENSDDAAKAAAKTTADEKAAADQVVAAKAAAAKAATDSYAAAKAVTDKAVADKVAVEKVFADKTAAANAAVQQAAAVEASAKKTAADLAVAVRAVGEKTALLEHVQRHAAAIRIGKRLNAEKLASYRAYKNSGLVYAGLKQWNPALQSYGFGISQNPEGDVEFFHNFALAYYNMPKRQTGGLNKAIGYLKQATKLDPKHLASHSLLGDVYMVPTGRRGTFNPLWTRSAIHSLLRAAELNPKDANIPYRLANVYTREKRFLNAYASYEKALKLDPGNPGFRRQYAETLVNEKRYQTALEKLDAKGERAASLPEQLVRGNALIGLERWKELQALCAELKKQTEDKKLLGQINRLNEQANRALAQRKQVGSEKLVVILFGDGGKAVDTWRDPERDAIPYLWNQLRPLGALREAVSLEGHYLPQDFAVAIATGQWQPAPAGPATFHQQVRPLLMQHCGECHQQGNEEGEFVVDDFEKMLKGGESYPDEVVVAGKSGESQLLKSILEGEMPPDERLTDKRVTDLLKKWIDEGAQPGEKVAAWKLEFPTVLERFRAARKVPAEKVWAIVGNEALDPMRASTSEEFGAKVAPTFVCVPRLQAPMQKLREVVSQAETRNLERAARLELINKLTPQDLDMPLENPVAAQLVTDILKRDRHLDAADDRLVYAIAREVIAKHKPEVLLVSFCDPRHGSSPEEIRRADSSVFALWKQLQSIPEYRNNTNFVVITPFPHAGLANVLSIGPRIPADVVDRGEELVYNRPAVLTEAMVTFANMLSIDYEIPEGNLKSD